MTVKVTYGLTACTTGSAPGPTLGNEYGRTLLFMLTKYGWALAVFNEKDQFTIL